MDKPGAPCPGERTPSAPAERAGDTQMQRNRIPLRRAVLAPAPLVAGHKGAHAISGARRDVRSLAQPQHKVVVPAGPLPELPNGQVGHTSQERLDFEQELVA